MSTTTWIVLGVIVLLVLWIIVVYNGLVAMRQHVGKLVDMTSLLLRVCGFG